MVRIKLKKIIKKESSALNLLLQVTKQLEQNICILDHQGSLIFGALPCTSFPFENLEYEKTSYGKVFAGEFTLLIKNFLIDLLKKEIEKRKLGNEVLDLYREINLIHNFAQKLGNTIDQNEIAKLSLKEARQAIPADAGGVLFFSSESVASSLNAEFTNSPSLKAIIGDSAFWAFYLLGKKEANIINNIIWEGQTLSLIFSPLRVKDESFGIIFLINEKGRAYPSAELKLINTLSMQAAVALQSVVLFEKNVQAIRDKEKAVSVLHEAANCFVPNAFLKFLGYDKITQVKLGDSVEAEVTVLFSDIRGYTSLSEDMTPTETFDFVNAFNNRMGPLIRQNHGFINQYLGDGIMAIFPGNPLDALKAAIEMHRQLEVYNKERIAKNRKVLKIGIGLHTGPLILGITGDQHRMDAATISDTVNTAARIESLTKKYGVNILLSGTSLSRIFPEIEKEGGEALLIRYLGQTKVKGKSQLIEIYECFNGDPKELKEQKKMYLDGFESVVRCFDDQNFLDAITVLDSIQKEFPKDKTTKVLLDKFASLLPG